MLPCISYLSKGAMFWAYCLLRNRVSGPHTYLQFEKQYARVSSMGVGTEIYRRLGGLQPGKKVFATILDACPLVTLLFGLKYGLCWRSHGSPGPPHG
jgi:hypothetical protein